MTTSDNLTQDELATPLGQAFAKLIGDAEFAGAVADDPAAALAGMGVGAEHHDALVHDGALIAAAAPEVQGFGDHSSPLLMSMLCNNENVTGILVNNENITGILVNNENIDFMTPGRIRMHP